MPLDGSQRTIEERLATTVLLFAALRDAAGERRLESAAATVRELVAELQEAYGEPFTSRLRQATVVVDGEPTPSDSDRSLEDVSEVALLPPFSGGAG